MLEKISNDRFFLSPISGRVIKSSGKLYNMLKSDGFIVDKHKCFYNIKSAKSCMDKLFKLYPLLEPPSKFKNIAKTYKKGDARGFIQDKQTNIVGYVTKKGKVKKLKTPIKATNKNFIKVEDPYNMLQKIMDKLKRIDDKTQKLIEQQLKKETMSEIKSIVYNPVQNDFIPIKEYQTVDDQKLLIQNINEILIPESLPPLTKDSSISGLVKDNNEIIGIVTSDNIIKKITPKIHIKLDKESPVFLIQKETKFETIAKPEPEVTQPEPEPEVTQPEPEPELVPEITEPEPDVTQTEPEPEVTQPEPEPEVTQPEPEPEVTQPEPEPEVTQPEPEVTEPVSEPEPQEDLISITPSDIETEIEEKEKIIEEKLIPSVPILEATEEVKEELEKVEEIPSEKVLEEITCLDGEQFDINSKRCLPCSHYNLVWDDQFKKCKIELSPEIGKVIIVDDKIIGYTG
jgi:hypothetical protein